MKRGGSVGTWVRWLTWIVGGVGAVGVVLAAQETQQRPTFRGGARFVRVDVYPTGKDGKPVEGLIATDFQVLEDGKPQAVDTFEFIKVEPDVEAFRRDPNSQSEGEEWAKDPRARVFVFVLDTRHVDMASSRTLRRPLTDMVDRLLGPRDLFGVITPELPVSSLLLGRKTLTAADMLEKYWTWGVRDHIGPQDETERFLESCFGVVTMSAFTRQLIERYRERQILQHLDALIAKLATIREERKTVVVVTQGWRLPGAATNVADQMSSKSVPGISTHGGRIIAGESPVTGMADPTRCFALARDLLYEDLQRRFRQLLPRAQQSNVSFYPLDPRGLAAFDTPLSHSSATDVFPMQESLRLRQRADSLYELAENTDGTALLMNNDLRAQFQRLGEILSSYYLLGYYSTNTKFDGGYRRLEVKVTKPGVRVKARRGYFAPTEEEIAAITAGRAAAARPVPAETMALSAALGRLDELRHDRDLFVQAARVADGLVLNIELGVNARQSAAWQKGGEVRVLISAGADQITETRAIEPMRSGVTLRVPLSAPGEIRIDARARTAAAGAADATATVPPASASLIGDVLSYRGLARALQPAADGRYRRTERATIEAPLAAGAIPAGVRVLDRAGKPLNVPIASRERIDAQGTRWIAAELALAPLTDGDYVIELEVMKDAQRERKLFAIRVVR